MYSINYVWSKPLFLLVTAGFFLVRACVANWSTTIGLNGCMFIHIVFADHQLINAFWILLVRLPVVASSSLLELVPYVDLVYRSSDIFGIDINCYWNRKIPIFSLFIQRIFKTEAIPCMMWMEKHASTVTKQEFPC